MAYFLRTEESEDDAQRALVRGRSANGWNLVGMDPIDWATAVMPTDDYLLLTLAIQLAHDHDLPSFGARGLLWLEDHTDPTVFQTAIIHVLALEPVSPPATGYWQPLPGLCALAESSTDLGTDPHAWLALVPTHDGFQPDHCFAYLAIYSGTWIAVDEAGWPLFQADALLRVFPNPAWDGQHRRWIEIQS
jgi:hypothetical protein